MKEIVEIIAKSLVENPDAVVVDEKDEDGMTVLELHVAQEDMGKARAMRTVVKAAATRENKKVSVEIV